MRHTSPTTRSRPSNGGDTMAVILKAFVASAFLAWMLLRQQLHLDDGNEPPGPGFNSTVIPTPPEVCTNRDCVVAAALYHTNMDADIDPCQDFGSFTCGNYRFYNEIPPGKPEQTPMNSLRNRVSKQLSELLTSPDEPSDKQYETLAKKYFKKCMDTKTINNDPDHKKLMTVMKQVFNASGYPSIFGGKLNSILWPPMFGHLLLNTLNVPIVSVGVAPYGGDSSKNVLKITQSPWTLIEYEDAYHEKPDNELVEALFKMLSEDVLKSLNVPVNDAKDMARKIIEFEKELVKHKVKNFNDPAVLSNYMNRTEFKQRLKTLNTHFMTGLLRRYKLHFRNTKVYYASLNYLQDIQEFVMKAPSEVVMTYAVLIWMKSMSGYIDDTISTPFKDYARLARGIKDQPSREEECINMVTRDLPLATSNLYLKSVFDLNKVQEPATELVEDIKKYVIEQLEGSKWLDDATKNKAITKIKKLRQWVGYPSCYKDDALMNKKHKCFTPTSDSESFIALGQRISQCNNEAYFDKLLGSDNPDEFGFLGDVNVAYQPSSNTMGFFSGILQYPFLLPDAPKYVVFGAFGTIIGRELQHVFDELGSHNDENGNLVNWWTAAAKQEFADKAGCFDKQYTHAGIDGDSTNAEDIADNAGLKTAFGAYRKWLNDHPNEPEKILPGFEHYTPEQMFFITWANNWCNIYNKNAIEKSADHVHAPTLRLNMPALNSLELNDAFSCPKGSPTNPEEKCNFW
uniref:Neprilysin n=1 Tax=Panagrellus redivivus TaxID=6233 RepID=A0A7E4W330_PANRE